MIHYQYAHAETEATTGYFACSPTPALTPSQALQYLANHPLDDFMRRHLFTLLSSVSSDEVRDLFTTFYKANGHSSAVASFAEELTILSPSLLPVLAPYLPEQTNPAEASAATPLVIIAWNKLPDKHLHMQWGTVFNNNIQHHKALAAPSVIGLPPLYVHHNGTWQSPEDPTCTPTLHPYTATVGQVAAANDFLCHTPYVRPPAEETATLAQERLEACGIIAGQEMRHVASLSPIALLRPWNVALTVQHKRHNFTLQGRANTYGRGLSVGQARASCLMEMVERASLYVSVKDDTVLDRAEHTALEYATQTEMHNKGYTTLDICNYPTEVAYTNAPLTWVAGHTPNKQTVWVPLQMVTLFSNLDEVCLFDSLGSTGIATGNTIEEAKLAALTEILERDAEATTPFTKQGCFTLSCTEGLVGQLLADYKARGINVQFQDITGPMGVPAYKCFVMSPKGLISRGHGAHLDARKAVISALTETPFPYPHGGASGPSLRNLPQVEYEQLPNFALETAAQSLALLEATLLANNKTPVYVTLTHKTLQFPVVRAFIPGMELAADRDAFSRIPLQLYSNYLNIFSNE